MSLIYNDTTTYKGIIQLIEKELGFPRGYISGNVDRLKETTADVNLALDDYFDIGFKNSGTWQLDDSNHEDTLPSIKTNLVSGRRDYAFIEDEEGNLVLDIYRVMVADRNGLFKEIYPVDQQTRNSNQLNTDTLIDGRNKTGIPTRYDKTANGILLDLIPDYNASLGLKVFINREASYFEYNDTTKKPGVPGTHHRYFVLKPSLDYARRKSLTALPRLEVEVFKMEQIIADTFGKRERDIIRRAQANIENTR